jgi:hypothetical protein
VPVATYCARKQMKSRLPVDPGGVPSLLTDVASIVRHFALLPGDVRSPRQSLGLT